MPLTTAELKSEIEAVKRQAEEILKADPITDIKRKHQVCAMAGISTATYNDIVFKSQKCDDIEIALKIIENWPQKPTPARKASGTPDFKTMVQKSSQGAGVIK